MHDLPIHQACAVFPCMDVTQLKELAEDIRAQGLLNAITVMPSGEILDGRNRAMACDLIGITPMTKVYEGDDPLGFVISQNIMRRHLTVQQKKELVRQLLKENPSRPNRTTGKIVGLSDKTVSKVRVELEAESEIPTDGTVTTSRGQRRKSKLASRGTKQDKESQRQLRAAANERHLAAVQKGAPSISTFPEYPDKPHEEHPDHPGRTRSDVFIMQHKSRAPAFSLDTKAQQKLTERFSDLVTAVLKLSKDDCPAPDQLKDLDTKNLADFTQALRNRLPAAMERLQLFADALGGLEEVAGTG